jgi:hypothetical protein
MVETNKLPDVSFHTPPGEVNSDDVACTSFLFVGPPPATTVATSEVSEIRRILAFPPENDAYKLLAVSPNNCRELLTETGPVRLSVDTKPVSNAIFRMTFPTYSEM